MAGPVEFFIHLVERVLFGNSTLPSPGKIERKSPYLGTVTFANCPNGCPGLMDFKNKPNCEFLIFDKGIKFKWNHKKYVIQEMGDYEIQFLKTGEVRILRGDNNHDCYPRTFPVAISQGHLRAIQILLQNEEEPTHNDLQQAVRSGHKEITHLLRAKREELDRLEGFLLVE